MEYNTMEYNTMEYNTMEYNTMEYGTMEYNMIQYILHTWQMRSAAALISRQDEFQLKLSHTLLE